MRTFRAEVASEASYELAEGPFWDAERERLLWVDIAKGKVLCGRLRAHGVEVSEEHRFPGLVAAVVPTADSGLLVTLHRGFGAVTPDGTLRTGRLVLPATGESRFNDGACDPVGRFLVGTMSLDGRRRTERLYRLDGTGAVEVIDDGLTLSNGLGWSPDGQTLYHVDSVPGTIWSRTYDPVSGDIGPRRIHLRIDEGAPDGLCVDTDGNLWVAVWGAGQVRCFDAAGDQVATVEVAAPHTSSVAFVGSARDLLLITTARTDLPAARLDASPLSGRLFLADVGARGLPTAQWAGHCADIT
ncbi:MAG: SMP-30/gluconolactonase/LRE family protein [Nocardioidaceae bacterium]